MCVTWFASPASAETAVAERPCPCCVPVPATDDAPVAPDECPGCGWRDAGRGVVPAVAVPPLPEGLVARLEVVPPPLLAAVAPVRTEEAAAAGPPSARLEGVVLID
jgi:hypothetical protein